ncbi:IS3 family transposase [Facklamia sp. P12950]
MNHEEEKLIEEICRIVDKSRGSYGYRRVTADLKNSKN